MSKHVETITLRHLWRRQLPEQLLMSRGVWPNLTCSQPSRCHPARPEAAESSVTMSLLMRSLLAARAGATHSPLPSIADVPLGARPVTELLSLQSFAAGSRLGGVRHNATSNEPTDPSRCA